MDLFSLAVGAGGGGLLSHLLGRTREYRKDVHGVADLLAWEAVVGEGLLMQRDGALLAGWRYAGPDMKSATVHERNALAGRINEALLPFASGWMFHIDAVRRPAADYPEGGAFPDPLTRLIEEERRQSYQERDKSGQYRFYETEYILVATYLPPKEVYERLGTFFVRGAAAEQGAVRAIDACIEQFEEAARALQARLGALLTMERLGAADLLRHLHFTLTGRRHAIRVPEVGYSLNAYLADQEVYGGFRPRVGGRHVRVVALHGYPDATYQGVLDAVHNYASAYRWSSRIIMLSDEEAGRLLRERRQVWFNKWRGLSSLISALIGSEKSERAKATEEELFKDGDAFEMTKDVTQALRRIASSTARYCLFTSSIVIIEDKEGRAEETAHGLLKLLHEAGFPARVETVNAFEAYLGSLPGHGWPNLRRNVLHTRNIADLIPATKVWAGTPSNPSSYFPPESPALMWTKTEGSTPFRVNLHAAGDVGHTLVVGTTGAGKSVLVNTLIAQWLRYEGAQAVLFDVGYSGWLLAQGAGARHYDLRADEPSGLGLQPLSHIDEPSELAWAASWVETLMGMQGVSMTPERRSELERALRLVAREEPALRTLRLLKVQVQDEALATALAPFVRGGVYGHLMDSGSADTEDSHYQVFELSEVRQLKPEVFVPLLLCLFRRIERRLGHGRPTLIVLEEVWSALMQTAFADRIKEWLLTLRKQNAAVVLVAHTPAQIDELDSREVILDSCPTKIFLPNPEALDVETRRLYLSMGLNEREVEIIAQAEKKKEYFFKSPAGSRLFDLDLGPLALRFLTLPRGENIEAVRRRVDALQETFGKEWPAHWLEEEGEPDWADALLSLMQDLPHGDASSLNGRSSLNGESSLNEESPLTNRRNPEGRRKAASERSSSSHRPP